MVQNLELSKIALKKETPLIQIVVALVLPLDKINIGIRKEIILVDLAAGVLFMIFLGLRKMVKNILKDEKVPG